VDYKPARRPRQGRAQENREANPGEDFHGEYLEQFK
jgi:hypothetical protein